MSKWMKYGLGAFGMLASLALIMWPEEDESQPDEAETPAVDEEEIPYEAVEDDE